MSVDTLGNSGRTAHDFSAIRYGGPIRAEQNTVTINTANTRVLAGNPRRVHAVLCNRSVNFGAISLVRLLASSAGILVGANGGIVVLDVFEDGDAVGYEWFAISDTAAGSWEVYEVMRI